MKFITLFLIIGIVLLGYLGVFLIATAPHDPAIWHVDPLEVETSDTPNSFRMARPEQTSHFIDREAPLYSEPALTLARAFDEFALSQRSTVRIAGLPDELMMTYVQRTEKLKFPDYITVKFIDLGDGTSTIAVYSRSRYGYADLGVNQARVERWVNTLSSFKVEDAGN